MRDRFEDPVDFLKSMRPNFEDNSFCLPVIDRFIHCLNENDLAGMRKSYEFHKAIGEGMGTPFFVVLQFVGQYLETRSGAV